MQVAGRGQGAKGKDGQIAFVIYGPKGFEESGGFPYRLIFDKQDSAEITSIVGGLATKDRSDVLVYGQEIEYGPVAPANVGELRSPPCQLRTQFSLKDTVLDTIYGQTFEGLKAASKDPGAASSERMGITKMDKSFYRNVNFTLPSVAKALGAPLDANKYPFPDKWSESLKRDLSVSFCWTVEGLSFRPMKEDKENDWILDQKLTRTIDVPAVLVKKTQPQANKETSVQVAMSIDASQKLPVAMGVKCQLRGSNAPNDSTKVMLRISAAGFTPNIAGDFGGLLSGPPGPGSGPTPEITRAGDFVISAYSNVAPLSLMAGEEKSFKATLALPNDAAAVAGSLIQSRAEYWYNGVLAAYGPPATTYVAHPLPPSDGGPADVLVLCHKGFLPKDFSMLKDLFTVCNGTEREGRKGGARGGESKGVYWRYACSHIPRIAYMFRSLLTMSVCAHAGMHLCARMCVHSCACIRVCTSGVRALVHGCVNRYSECVACFWTTGTTRLQLKATPC